MLSVSFLGYEFSLQLAGIIIMRATYLLFSICTALLISVVAEAQQISNLCEQTTIKKARNYYDDAMEAFKARKPYEQIKSLCEKSTEEDPTYAAAWKLMGDAAWRRSDLKTARMAYEKTLENCADAGADVYYRLGDYYFGLKNFNDAVKYLKGYKEMGDEDSARNVTADRWLMRAQLMQHPVPFSPVRLQNICTPDPEYLPVISADNELCFFTRRFDDLSKGSLTARNVEKFMLAKKQPDGTYDKGTVMEPPFNRNPTGNEGAATISIDNTHLYFAENDKGNFDLYESVLTAKGWSIFKNLGPNINDPKQWDSQPCIAPDDNTLYFVSYRDSINQTSDIFFTTKNADGEWTKAKSLNSVNTSRNEKSPFMHADNHTLYFSSDGLPGMGGYDIFYIKRDEKGNWGKPVNLGYPINTEADEVGFFVSIDGKKGYFSSNLIPNSGSYDIYSFEIPENARPEKVLLLKGELKDENDEVPTNARIELKNIQTKDITQINYDTLTGRYAKVILFNDDYIMTVKQKGYAFNSSFYSKDDTLLNEPRKSDFSLKKIEINTAYELKNILFETASSTLDSNSQYIIQDFAEFLNENPNVKIEIRGHTDNQGNTSENMKLSNDRAKSVYDYLISLKVNTQRLSYKGYGPTIPIVANDTDENRAQNRRTEFYILNK